MRHFTLVRSYLNSGAKQLFSACRAQQLIALVLMVAVSAPAAPAAQPEAPATGGASLTIYNADFAVVRQSVPLSLKPGVNPVHFADATAMVDPESVMLRDPSGRHPLQIQEQSYRADPLTEMKLLSLFEGKVIDFEVREKDSTKTVPGRVVRSGYVPAMVVESGYQPVAQMEPIIEMDGRLQFGLPGRPLFPSLGDDTILKPRLDWLLRSGEPATLDAELSYLTGGLRWQADYNLVAADKGDTVDLVGWVSFQNNSGKTFENARIKLLAGDVNKVERVRANYEMVAAKSRDAAAAPAPPVSEQSFDEFHLYTLANAVTLRDHESKQVEFARANGVHSQRLYIYDGADMGNYYGWDMSAARSNPEYGSRSNSKVWVVQELKNSEANHLGIALPRGKLRFYRRNADGQLEFTGENTIEHTPKDETLRIYTGNAFDIKGERKRTDFHFDKHTAEESFEIRVRNHKKEAAEVRVVEHLYRWTNWQILQSSDHFEKKDAQTAEFRVNVPANEERVVTYTVRYSW